MLCEYSARYRTPAPRLAHSARLGARLPLRLDAGAVCAARRHRRPLLASGEVRLARGASQRASGDLGSGHLPAPPRPSAARVCRDGAVRACGREALLPRAARRARRERRSLEAGRGQWRGQWRRRGRGQWRRGRRRRGQGVASSAHRQGCAPPVLEQRRRRSGAAPAAGQSTRRERRRGLDAGGAARGAGRGGRRRRGGAAGGGGAARLLAPRGRGVGQTFPRPFRDLSETFCSCQVAAWVAPLLRRGVLVATAAAPASSLFRFGCLSRQSRAISTRSRVGELTLWVRCGARL